MIAFIVLAIMFNVEWDLDSLPATYTIYGANAGDEIGWWEVHQSGDINGDGKEDIAFGAPTADGPGNSRLSCGEVYIIYGDILSGERDLNTTPADYTIYGAESGDSCGFAIALGDINGDGKSDIIVGALKADGPGNSRIGCGEVYVIYGGNLIGYRDLLTDSADFTILGINAGDDMGEAVSSGDVNGDGFWDIIIGARAGDGPNNTRFNCGEVYVIYGGNLSGVRDLAVSSPDYIIYGADARDLEGCGVSAFDLNGDNKAEVLSGAPLADGPSNTRLDCGEAYVIYGNNLIGVRDLNTQPADYTIFCPDPGDRGGRTVVGDVNGDSVADLFIGGAHGGDGPNNSRLDCGEVYIIYGPIVSGVRDLRTDSADYTVFGADAYDELGRFLYTGDINSDGRSDLIIGAYGADGPGNTRSSCGETYIIWGGSLTGTRDLQLNPADFIVYGADPSDSTGRFVFALDIDHNGSDELLISAPKANGPGNNRLNSGEVYLLKIEVGINEPQSQFGGAKLFASPNPFTQKTVIRVQGLGVGSQKSEPRIQIYDLAGKLVRSFSLIPNPQSPITSIVWDGKDNKGERMPAGIYFVELKACEVSQIEAKPKSRFIGTRKLILLRL